MTPEKLTIEHLAPYLPNKLKWIFGGDDAIHEVVGLEMSWVGLHLISPDGSFGRCEIERGKPILRPVSDITNEKMVEILADTFGWGEKIVFKLYDDEIWVTSKEDDYLFDPEVHETESDYEYDYLGLKDEADGESVITCPIPFTMSQNLSWGTGEFKYFVCAKHYLRFIQELCKRHYDVFGLIAAGLAVDINTIEL